MRVRKLRGAPPPPPPLPLVSLHCLNWVGAVESLNFNFNSSTLSWYQTNIRLLDCLCRKPLPLVSCSTRGLIPCEGVGWCSCKDDGATVDSRVPMYLECASEDCVSGVVSNELCCPSLLLNACALFHVGSLHLSIFMKAELATGQFVRL